MCVLFCVIGWLVQVLLLVLINGEIGIGKELVVYVLYYELLCVVGLFVVFNIVVIFVELLESELFGYEVGVFIGVQCCYVGCFEQVYGGMLFLDEIGDMLLLLQICLLCVLVEGEFFCVGGCELIWVDVCVIVVIY